MEAKTLNLLLSTAWVRYYKPSAVLNYFSCFFFFQYLNNETEGKPVHEISLWGGASQNTGRYWVVRHLALVRCNLPSTLHRSVSLNPQQSRPLHGTYTLTTVGGRSNVMYVPIPKTPQIGHFSIKIFTGSGLIPLTSNPLNLSSTNLP